MKSTINKNQPIAPVEVQRTVHSLSQGTVKTRFVLHPNHVRVGKGIDEIDGTTRNIGSVFDMNTAKSGEIVITRELMLSTLARYPQGILVKELCEVIIRDENSVRSVEEIKARVYAMLKREVKRGSIKPEFGKGNLRKLTAQGVEEAASIAVDMARQRASRERIAKAREKAQKNGTSTMVNSAFDYGRKVQLGVLSTLTKHSSQN